MFVGNPKYWTWKSNIKQSDYVEGRMRGDSDLARMTVGRPKGTTSYTTEELEEEGLLGLYSWDPDRMEGDI